MEDNNEDYNNFPNKLYMFVEDSNQYIDKGNFLFDIKSFKRICRANGLTNSDIRNYFVSKKIPIFTFVEPISKYFAIYAAKSEIVFGKALIKKIGDKYKLINTVKEKE